VACTFHEAFDALLEAYKRIGEHIPLLKQYEDCSSNTSHMRELSTLFYEDVLQFHRKAMQYFKQKSECTADSLQIMNLIVLI
jgi:hypothetical protein